MSGAARRERPRSATIPDHGHPPSEPRSVLRAPDDPVAGELLVRVAAVEAMARVVARRLEGSRPGSRFPLLRLVGRPAPLSPTECDALVREVERLRRLLAPIPAAEDGPPPPDAPRPASLAHAFRTTLDALERVARLGATTRRGARFEPAPG